MKRVIDLSLPIDPNMPGVQISTARRLKVDGWNATNLSLYSHSGTHMDAPVHFLGADGTTLDQQDLHVCVGPATVINLAPASPRQLIRVDDLGELRNTIRPGMRLLFRTDWHKRFGTAAYRDELPRISVELARWLVDQQVSLIGVEPPSVADVNNLAEVTEVHHTLFRGNIVIVEGLAHLDQLQRAEVEFIALPLNVTGGDGSPVRAIAIESVDAESPTAGSSS